MPDRLGLTSPKVGRGPVDEVGVKIGVADVSKKKMVLDGVEGFADVDGDGGCPHGRLLFVETDGDSIGERKKGG